MERSARKLVLARLRTRLMLFTFLLAINEVNGLPSCIPRQPGLQQKDAFRLLWFLSSAGFSAVSHRRYLRAPLTSLCESSAWYTDVLLKSLDSRFREHMRMSRPTFHVALDLLRTHTADLFDPRRGAAQMPLESSSL